MAWLPDVAGLLDELGVDWVIAGAAATYPYRTTGRFTTDLDLLVRWDEGLPAAARSLGYDVRVMAAPDDHPHLLQLHRGHEHVDLIVAAVDYQDEAIDRGLASHVLTVEDVLVHKLIAWRPRDREDIASILAGDPQLDLGYIEHWAREWDVLDRWQEARTRV